MYVVIISECDILLMHSKSFFSTFVYFCGNLVEVMQENYCSHAFEPRHDKMCLWEFPTRPDTNKMCLREFPTRPDTNRPAQSQKLARVSKFRL